MSKSFGEYYILKGKYGLAEPVDPFNVSIVMSLAVMDSDDKLGVIDFLKNELKLLENNVVGLNSVLGKDKEV